MKDQTKLDGRGGCGKRTRKDGVSKEAWAAVLLAFALVAGIWAGRYFSAVQRIRRASERIVEMTRKGQDESPMAIALASSRFGKEIAVDAVLELEPHGEIARGRQEIVQLFAQIRSQFARIVFEHASYIIENKGQGEVAVRVGVRYRFESGPGSAQTGTGTADLTWRKRDKGWQIERAAIRDESGNVEKGMAP